MSCFTKIIRALLKFISNKESESLNHLGFSLHGYRLGLNDRFTWPGLRLGSCPGDICGECLGEYISGIIGPWGRGCLICPGCTPSLYGGRIPKFSMSE